MDDLIALARAILPPGVAVAAADPRADRPVPPGAPPGAVPARLREFAAGRAAVARALAALGLPPLAVPMGADRAPLWPAGVTGSITHTATACLAAVAPAAQLAGLGLDLEPDRPLPPDLWDSVLTPAERAALPADDPGGRALTLFCAKEAAYKAQYPLTRTLIDFHTLQIAPDDARFTARLTRPVPPLAAGRALPGAWGRAGGHVLAVSWLAAG